MKKQTKPALKVWYTGEPYEEYYVYSSREALDEALINKYGYLPGMLDNVEEVNGTLSLVRQHLEDGFEDSCREDRTVEDWAAWNGPGFLAET